MNASTTATAGTMLAINLADLLRGCNQVGTEPIGEWMRSEGYPPECSTLMLPEVMRAQITGPLPHYVRFHPYGFGPVLCCELSRLRSITGGLSHG